MTDHLFRVPLDYSRGAEAGTIELFARVATSPSRAAAANAAAAVAAANNAANTKAAPPPSPSASVPPPPPDDGGPWLLYLQGGPGFEAPRPTEASSWLKAALHHGFRVVLLDQRGTGRSSPPVSPLAEGAANASSSPSSSSSSASLAAACGSEDPEVQARYLSHFRAVRFWFFYH
jgi:pimeloyl-ACP methyl ester carboxylesterase